MLAEVLISIALVLLLYHQWAKRDIYKLGKELNSGIRILPFLGHSYLFIGNSSTRMKAFETLGRDAISKENGLSSWWNGSYLLTMIAEPKTAELVLKTCLEKDDIVKVLKPYIGNGSIFAPVSIWRPRRKVLVPIFSVKNLKYFLKTFVKQSGVLAQELRKRAGNGPMSIFQYMTTYTMDAVAESTLGYKMGSQNDPNHPFLSAIVIGMNLAAERACQPWLHSDLVYTKLPAYTKVMKKKKYLWDFVNELIKAKQEELKVNKYNQEHDKTSEEVRPVTFLEALIKLSGGDKGYTNTEIIEELMVILIAGNDTSAAGSSFVTVMLSRHPEVQEKIFEELQEVLGDSDREVMYEDLPRLKYLDAVIKESLRLYPPVPIIVRKVQKHIVLPSGIKLVPGTGVAINIWALHRNPRYWGHDAEEFRPERFFDALPKHPAAFIPFSHGVRNCAGYQYAMMSMKTVISTLVQKFRILPAITPNSEYPKYPPLRLGFDIIMKDEDNYQIVIEPRRI